MLAKTRIAPTPSGYLHLGNLFSFALTWLMARKEGMEILLRIDDLDRNRYRPEYLEDIFRSFEAIGLSYDEGPQSMADFEAKWSQKHRSDLYLQSLTDLQELDLVFACNCSRKEIKSRSLLGFYDGYCLSKDFDWSQSSEMALRWKKSEGQAMLKGWHQSDFKGSLEPSLRYAILYTKEKYAAYQLSSLTDDLHFGISHIVRGQDLKASSIAQNLLASDLKRSDFQEIAFHHHPLIKHKSQKLSKSQNAPAAAIYKNPKRLNELLSSLASYLGLPESGQSLEELLVIFRNQK